MLHIVSNPGTAVRELTIGSPGNQLQSPGELSYGICAVSRQPVPACAWYDSLTLLWLQRAQEARHSAVAAH